MIKPGGKTRSDYENQNGSVDHDLSPRDDIDEKYAVFHGVKVSAWRGGNISDAGDYYGAFVSRATCHVQHETDPINYQARPATSPVCVFTRTMSPSLT